MVGRYVAPVLLVADFDPHEARLWPRQGTEAVVEAAPAVTIITTTSPFRGMGDGTAIIAVDLTERVRGRGEPDFGRPFLCSIEADFCNQR